MSHIACAYSTIDSNGVPTPVQMLLVTSSPTGNTYTIPRLAAGSTGFVRGVLVDSTFGGPNAVQFDWTVTELSTIVTDLGSNKSISNPVTITELETGTTGLFSLIATDNNGNIVGQEQFMFKVAPATVITYTGADCGKVIEVADSNNHRILSNGLDTSFKITFVAVGAPRTISADQPINGYLPGNASSQIILQNDGDSVTLMYGPDNSFQVTHKSFAPTNDVCFVSATVPDDMYIDPNTPPQMFPAIQPGAFSNFNGPLYLHPAGNLFYTPATANSPASVNFKPSQAGLYLIQFEIHAGTTSTGQNIFMELTVTGGGDNITEQVALIPADPNNMYFTHQKRVTVVVFLSTAVHQIAIRNTSPSIPFSLMRGSAITATFLAASNMGTIIPPPM